MRKERLAITLILLLSLSFACSTSIEKRIAERLDNEIVPCIENDLAKFNIPGISLAVVLNGKILWNKGLGFQDREQKIPATPETVYRVGSISKLFNAVAIMQQQEKGLVDLDADIKTYLPYLEFENHFDKRLVVTLRHLLSHKAGILRECPVGHYFDDTEPSIEATVKSMVGTPLIYPPGSKTKYSNIGVCIAGHILEKLTDMDFATYQKEYVLKPLNMNSSSFLLEDISKKKLAKGYMRDLGRKQWEAPGFRFGHLPASNLYSNVIDLSEFINFILNEGKSILKKDTLTQMFSVQFEKPENTSGFGLGFFISEIHNFQTVGHSGAVYGFSSNLLVIPEKKLGIVVLNNLDGANGFNSKIVSHSLGIALEEITGEKILDLPDSKDLSSTMLKKYQGRFERNGFPVWLTLRDDSLFYEPFGTRKQLTPVSETEFITDDLFGYGERIRILKEKDEINGIEINNRFFKKTEVMPEKNFSQWSKFIGDYGPDYNIMNLYIKEGKLTVLIEWFYEYPLEHLGGSNFKFPDYGLYMDEELVFREADDRLNVQVGPVLFKRRR